MTKARFCLCGIVSCLAGRAQVRLHRLVGPCLRGSVLTFKMFLSERWKIQTHTRLHIHGSNVLEHAWAVSADWVSERLSVWLAGQVSEGVSRYKWVGVGGWMCEWASERQSDREQCSNLLLVPSRGHAKVSGVTVTRGRHVRRGGPPWPCYVWSSALEK